MRAIVIAVGRNAPHSPDEPNRVSIRLLGGKGVEGDAHLGKTAKHRSRVTQDPTRPNLRQVHLIHAELHDELQDAGFAVSAGQMGENITTRGVRLLELPTGTRLLIGARAVVKLTGLRNPCAQLDRLQPGLLQAVLAHNEHGNLVRKAGVMAVVDAGGVVRPGDEVRVVLPPEPHRPLDRV